MAKRSQPWHRVMGQFGDRHFAFIQVRAEVMSVREGGSVSYARVLREAVEALIAKLEREEQSNGEKETQTRKKRRR